eukprot:tig00021583_g22652.t1
MAHVRLAALNSALFRGARAVHLFFEESFDDLDRETRKLHSDCDRPLSFRDDTKALLKMPPAELLDRLSQADVAFFRAMLINFLPEVIRATNVIAERRSRKLHRFLNKVVYLTGTRVSVGGAAGGGRVDVQRLKRMVLACADADGALRESERRLETAWAALGGAAGPEDDAILYAGARGILPTARDLVRAKKIRADAASAFPLVSAYTYNAHA